MKKRWICLFVENDVGVLARISGLFSAKSYNLNSLTVGPAEDETVSRMTIGLTSDDKTFEQVKKQLNRCIEVIKVVDFTESQVYRKELMFLKLTHCTAAETEEIFRIAGVAGVRIADCGRGAVLLESVETEEKNQEITARFREHFSGRMEIIRGGTVAVEGCLPPE